MSEMVENIKQTCLYGSHLKLGAKMSPFAGFMMPIQYSSIIAEHNAVREKVGMFDVSHMGEITVEGEQAEEFVDYVFTNSVKGLEEGKILYGMMCYPDGGVVDDLLVYREFAPKRFLLVVNAANTDKDLAWLRENLLHNPRTGKAFDCSVSDDSSLWGQIALQGPLAEKTTVEVLGLTGAALTSFYTFYEDEWEGERVIVSRTGYTGEDGFEFYASPAAINRMWDVLLAAGVTPCGLGCRDTLRFEAGMPLYGDELSAEISPIEAGLGMFVSFEKDFIGKEALLSQKENGPARKLVGIALEDNAVPRAGYPVELQDGTEIGVVTTGYHSVTLDRSLCFALVPAALSAHGTRLFIRIRKKVFPGAVVGKRFYRTNYKK